MFCLRESQKVFSISDFNTHKRTKHGLLPNIRSVKDSKQNLYNTYVTWNKLSGWDFGDVITAIPFSSCKNEMDVLIRLKTETSQASSKPSFKVPLSLLYIYMYCKRNTKQKECKHRVQAAPVVLMYIQ